MIVDAQGNLEYQKIVSALKLLGSKFFHEVQAGSKIPHRTKTYDVNAVLDDEPQWGYQDEDFAYVGESWKKTKSRTMRETQMPSFACSSRIAWLRPSKGIQSWRVVTTRTWMLVRG